MAPRKKKPVIPAPVAVEVEVLPPAPAEDSLFEGLDLEPEQEIMLRPNDGIPPLDGDLAPTEKKLFIDLLNRHMSLEARARQLVKLAQYTDTKRAPVGLRALQEINAITGISGEQATETAPMFQLPPDTRIDVRVTKVVK